MLTKDNNLNIRQFKLLNGEEIIALVNEKDDLNYFIERPYKVNAGMVGGFYFVPWFPFSSQTLFKLSREKIVYHAEIDEDMKVEYVKLASEFTKPRPKPERLKNSDELVDSISANLDSLVDELDDIDELTAAVNQKNKILH